MSENRAILFLLAVAIGLVGGLAISRIGIRKGYAQRPFFITGFVALFALAWLPAVAFVPVTAFFILAMMRFPDRGSGGVGPGKHQVPRKPTKRSGPPSLPGFGE